MNRFFFHPIFLFCVTIFGCQDTQVVDEMSCAPGNELLYEFTSEDGRKIEIYANGKAYHTDAGCEFIATIFDPDFFDKHFIAEVHWSGENSSSIMVLMKDPDSFMTPTRPSYFYVSRDYGKTYANITSNFTLQNGSLAVISDFFSSKVNNKNYILVAKFHRFIFQSDDECRTFRRVSTYFYPSQIKFHPHLSYYVAVHEDDMGSQRVS